MYLPGKKIDCRQTASFEGTITAGKRKTAGKDFCRLDYCGQVK
jgi:hypothetical protein